ncbi:MAG: hypothetical protein Q7J69_02375 [Candidatus Omnitrophota bacterium]|nr:hypothetical protein [Candidatus Omnitrophota bacterium]
MPIRRRLKLFLAVLGLLALGFALFSAWFFPRLLIDQLGSLPVPVWSERPPRWSGFLQLTIDNLEISNPAGDSPPVLAIRTATVRAPWWGLLLRPMPIELTLESPQITMDTQMGNTLLQQVDFLPMGSTWQSAEEGQRAARQFGKIEPGSIKVVPVSLKIRDGRMDIRDAQVRKDAPLYSIAHLEADLWMTSPLEYPSIHFTARAQFVTKEDKQVGFLSARCQASATLKQMEGKLEIWYDQLEDFRWVYQKAPDPFTFDGGAGGPVIRWEYKEGRFKAGMQCRAKNLRIGGTIGGEVPWQQVLDTLADRNGEIDLTVETEGIWGDPGFDVHNRILSELDWAIKERAAAQGVRVPGRIFYGLLTDLI